MIPGWLVAARRVILKVTLRRRGHRPHVVRFHADRWHRFRVLVSAFQMNVSQPLDNIVMTYNNQPTLVIVRSNVEGVTYYKASATTEYVARRLRPFEVTDDVVWRLGERPTVVLSNPTARPAEVDVIFATRETGDGGGGLLF
jgi:hypothetical protein